VTEIGIPKTRLVEVDAYVERVRSTVADGDAILLARGRLRANPARGRFATVRQDGIEVKVECEVRLDQEPMLIAGLAAHYPLRVARWDGERILWTVDEGPFRVFARGGEELWRIEDDLLVGGGRRLTREEIVLVEAYVGADWVEQGARLELADGSRVEIASVQNTNVKYDWGYDGFTLEWDTSWCRMIARDLAEKLRVPYTNSI